MLRTVDKNEMISCDLEVGQRWFPFVQMQYSLSRITELVFLWIPVGLFLSRLRKCDIYEVTNDPDFRGGNI